MSNFAALIDVLSISGSRLSTGAANASGKVWFFQPGGNTPVNVYSDAATSAIVTAPVTLTAGGLVSLSDYPNGIFATQPIRLLIQDVSGNTVSDNVWEPATAGDTGLNNPGWTSSTVDGALTALYTSTGGQDGKYKESGGATARTVQAKFSEVWISVKDFGAVGDGVAIDTTAIQSALNRITALSGGTVYFPAGTYKVDQALTLSSVNGVTLKGNGIAATVITSTNATANGFTITSCNSLVIEGLRFSNSGTSTGKAFALTTCTRPTLLRVGTGDVSDNGVYRYGVYATTCNGLTIRDCHIFALPADAAARGIFAIDCPGTSTLGGTAQAAAGFSAEFDGSTQCNSYTTVLGGSVRFAATLTGIYFSFFGSIISGSLSIATATIPFIRMVGTGIDASATSSAVGAAQTPSLIAGNEVILSATSGGAGVVTVNSPAILPGTGASNGVDLYWDFVYKNASGGAVTWTQNAVFVTTAAIPTTDGHTIAVRYRWDRTTSKLREVSRADTVT